MGKVFAGPSLPSRLMATEEITDFSWIRETFNLFCFTAD